MEITLGSISMLQGTPWKSDKVEEAYEAQARIDAALGGIVEEHMFEQVRDQLAASDAKMDSVTAMLLVHHEIHPAIAMSMALHAGVLNMTNGMGRQALMLTSEQSRVLLDLDGRATWHSYGVLDDLPPIPETVIGVFQRMPLRDLVSHPALDPHDLHVEVLESRGGTHAVVSGIRWITAKELAATIPETVS